MPAQLPGDKNSLLPDIQSQVGRPDLRIDAVGIEDVRYPLTIRSAGKMLPAIAMLTRMAGLPATG